MRRNVRRFNMNKRSMDKIHFYSLSLFNIIELRDVLTAKKHKPKEWFCSQNLTENTKQLVEKCSKQKKMNHEIFNVDDFLVSETDNERFL
jgi:hypothetical protein